MTATTDTWIGELAQQHLDAAYNLGRWLLGNEQDASDAVHDAYVRAARAAHTYAGGNARAWWLAIVRNCCLAKLALRKRETHLRAVDERTVDCRCRTARGIRPTPRTGRRTVARVARRIPRGAGAARDRGSVVPRNRRCAECADRHGDVAPVARPRDAAARIRRRAGENRMNCETTLPLLEAYLDNELDRADAREVEAHLDTCEACRNALGKLDDVRRALRDDALKFSAPPRIARTHRRDAAREPNAHARPRWFSYRGRVRAGIRRRRRVDASVEFAAARADVAHDVFASHWRALAATSPIDVVSSDRHTVKPWFAGKVAQTPVVQDFADHGFALVRRTHRLCRRDARAGARLQTWPARHRRVRVADRNIAVVDDGSGLSARHRRSRRPAGRHRLRHGCGRNRQSCAIC